MVYPSLQCKVTEQEPGDGLDNDCDGRIDEEVFDLKDNDGDGSIDEDLDLVSHLFACFVNVTMKSKKTLNLK